MSNARSDCEVIIAGGGPVGLCLALLLSRAGVSVRVFEAEPAISLDLRASTFHPPTLDLLEPFEADNAAVAAGGSVAVFEAEEAGVMKACGVCVCAKQKQPEGRRRV